MTAGPAAPELVRAPWTAGQVASLNAYQESGKMHPFTCGNDDCPGVRGMHASLVAAEDGWHCPGCDYTQDWAHAFMAEWQVSAGTDGATAAIRPGYPLLMRVTGIGSKSTAAAALEQIREWGFIWRYKEANRRMKWPDEYRLTWPDDISGIPMMDPDWNMPCLAACG